MTPSISFINATNVHVDVTLEQTGALYYANKLAPSEKATRLTGAVWFTIKARYSDPHKAGVSGWSVTWPIAGAAVGGVAAGCLALVFPPAGLAAGAAVLLAGAAGAGASMVVTIGGVELRQHFKGAPVVTSRGWYAAKSPTVRITGGANWVGDQLVYEPLGIEEVTGATQNAVAPQPFVFGGGYGDEDKMWALQHYADPQDKLVLQSIPAETGKHPTLSLHARGRVQGHPIYSQLWRCQRYRYVSDRVETESFLIRNIDDGTVLTGPDGTSKDASVSLAPIKLENDHRPTAAQLWTIEAVPLRPGVAAWWIRNVESRFALCPKQLAGGRGGRADRTAFGSEEWMHTDRHFWLMQEEVGH
ncbi:hypothetical protein OC835_007009 [Tilletia horrida]|nr:hypothetical protein OC835_007009 [Tilletia horrida]